MAEVGDTIRIIYMSGEPQYSGKEGVIRTIDSMGQLHGSWGGLAVIPGEDSFEVIAKRQCPSGGTVDAIGSNPIGEIRVGSNPTLDTTKK